MTVGETRGMGWHPDLPDDRDYRPDHPSVSQFLARFLQGSAPRRLPRAVDLREFLSRPNNQGHSNSSAAYAVLGLIACLEARACGRTLDASTLFLHQVTLKMLGRTGNAGANLRAVLKALRRFGTPPERYWPHDAEHMNRDPSDGFLFSFQREFDPLQYLRLDVPGNGAETLRVVKALLVAGIPSAFGFSVPSFVGLDADIPYFPRLDSVRDGQAVVAVGYDDRRRIASTNGAVLIRNSWGTDWGEQGYGWLSYPFITNHLALDFWTVVQRDWMNATPFRRS